MKRTASVPTVLVALTLILSACSGAGTTDTGAPSVAPSVAPATPAPPPASLAPDTEQYVANAAELVKAAERPREREQGHREARVHGRGLHADRGDPQGRDGRE